MDHVGLILAPQWSMSAKIFEQLREDHDEQRRLLAALCETSGDSADRSRLLEATKKELAAHAKAEEKSLYAAMLGAEGAHRKARHSVAEHHEIDEIVNKLESTDPSTPRWLSVAKQLRHRVEHHLEEEEHEVFQLAGRVLDPSEKKQLIEPYEDVRGPTA